jgi:peptidoglycan/LPS O-acetylase OafA/YrhL
VAKEMNDIAGHAVPEAILPPITRAQDDALTSRAASVYRPDIDGLRALAVIAVILYHAGVPGFTGGYVGVDVFFVISGYLITQQLIQPASGGVAQRLATFYLRRARRILPALFVMLATVSVAAWLWLLPPDIVLLGKYIALNALMLGNLAGYTDFGYFVQAASLRPLLHLWSIGVEEQFYLLYPLGMLLLIQLWPSRLRSILSVLAAGSLVLCVYASYHMPVANFYLMPMRGWELGAGALLALGLWRAPRSRIVNECAAAIAVATLIACVVFYDPAMRYPGLFTLPVCAATAFLIASGAHGDARISQLLTIGPLVRVGLASYSLYLWHAPVLVFFNYTLLHEPRAGEMALAGALIATLAATSWVLIEQPVRTRRILRSNRSFVCTMLVFATLLLGTGLVLWRSEGFEKRFPPDVEQYTSKENGFDPEALRCLNRSDTFLEDGRICRFGTNDARRPKVLVWGDSHALALFPAFNEHATREDFALYLTIRSACRPLLGPTEDSGALSATKPCVSFNSTAKKTIDRIDPDIVVLNAFWMNYKTRGLLASDPVAHGRGEAFETALEHTVQQIARPGRRICVVHDSPLLDGRVPHVLAMARIHRIAPDSLRLPRSVADAQQADIDTAIDHLAARGLITAVDLRSQLCNSQFCPLEKNGWPLYFDNNHFAREGARVASPALSECLNVVK